jgi:hypothetical protein
MWTAIWALTIALILPFGLVVGTWLEDEADELAAPSLQLPSQQSEGQPPRC